MIRDMDPALVRIKYVSRASQPMTGADVRRLAHAAAQHNAIHGITGVLIATGGIFVQVLEGPAEAVAATFARIERDRRHRDLVVLRREPCTTRRFPSWSMRLLELDTRARDRMAPLVALVHDAARRELPAGRPLVALEHAAWRAVAARFGIDAGVASLAA